MLKLDFFFLFPPPSSPVIFHQRPQCNLIMTKIIKKDLKIRLYWHLQNYVIHLHYNEGIKIMHFIRLGFRRAPPGEIRQLQMAEVYLTAWTGSNGEALCRARQSSFNPPELLPVIIPHSIVTVNLV